MTQIVSADEFITNVLCELAQHEVRTLTLGDTLTDSRFEAAYDALLEASGDLDVEPDFSLLTNPYHGDSCTLRETLYAIRERGVVSINNPSFKTVEFRLSKDDAAKALSLSPLPKKFLSDLVQRFFLTEDASIGSASDTGSAPRAA